MRFPVWLTVIAAFAGLALVMLIGQLLIRPDLPLILSAGFDDETITPNADGENDITTFRYELARSASITLSFEAEDGTTYFFRENRERIARDYSVLFSAVVEGYVLEDEAIPGGVERRLMPNGSYTWRLVAENDVEREEMSGTFVVEDADSPLPVISVFTLSSPEFTPNQDGVNDRLIINVYQEKADVDVRAFLIDELGREIPITERLEDEAADTGKRYTFDYAGGVDLGQDPPPNGDYSVVVVAQDAVGQRIRREQQVTITMGGKHRAEIAPQFVDTDVFYTIQTYDERFYSDLEISGALIETPEIPEAIDVSLLTLPLGDMLVFRLTVRNYSDVLLRTTAPPPGTVYQQGQQAASLAAFQEPGAWRVGIQCDSSTQSFPYRWAIGTEEDLITIEDPDTGRAFRYLPANSRSVVWGAIRMLDLNERINPQKCWAGLIHEQVGITLKNQFVDPREIELVDPLGRDSQ